MYHFVVRRKLRKAFGHINRGEYAKILPEFAPVHRHVMYGDHALAGERRTPASTARWDSRLAHIFPDLQFDLSAIAVTGWPWRTIVMVAWKDRFTLPDGSSGGNQGVHEFELRWGRVHRLEVHCDSARLAAYCDRIAAAGVADAAAAPITDVETALD